MAIVASLTALLKLDTRGFSGGLKGAINNVKKFNRQLTFASRDIQTAGANLTALTAPFALFGASSIKAAAVAEEQANIIKTTFSDMQESAKQSINQFANDFDIANSEATRLIATTGSLLTGFDFTQEAALELSDKINRLAADLTSFDPDVTNVADAAERLTNGLLGQTRGMLALKIAIRQDTAEFQNMKKQIMETEGVTEQAAKAMAIFREALKQSKNAIGDYDRTSGSFINTLRRINQRFIDLKIEVGKFLIEGLELGPVLIKIADGFTKVIKFIKRMSPDLKKLISRVLLAVAALGPLLLIFGSLGLAVTGITSLFVKLGGILTAILSPVGLIVAAVVALGVALVKTFDIDIVSLGKTILGFLLNLKTNMQIAGNFVSKLFSNVWKNIGETSSKLWENVVKNVEVAAQKFGAVWGVLFEHFVLDWDDSLKSALEFIGEFNIDAIKMVWRLGKKIAGVLKAAFTGSIGLQSGIIVNYIKGIETGLDKGKRDSIWSLRQKVRIALANTDNFVNLGKGLEHLVPMFPGFITGLQNVLADLDEKGPDGKDKKKGKTTPPPGIAELFAGSIASATKGSIEAFRIRAGQEKAEKQTADNTKEIKNNTKEILEKGILFRDLSIYDFSTMRA